MANDPIEFQNATGLTLTANLYDSTGLVTSKSMSESPASSGRYIVTAANLSAVNAGTYGVRIEDGSSVFYGYGSLAWDGSAELDTFTLDASVTAVNGGSVQVTADRASEDKTWHLSTQGYTSANIVTVKTWSTGTRTFGYDLARYFQGTDSAILTVDAVSVVNDDDATSITTSNLRKHQNGTTALFDLAAIASAGTFTVTVSFTTIDTNSEVVTATLSAI